MGIHLHAGADVRYVYEEHRYNVPVRELRASAQVILEHGRLQIEVTNGYTPSFDLPADVRLAQERARRESERASAARTARYKAEQEAREAEERAEAEAERKRAEQMKVYASVEVNRKLVSALHRISIEPSILGYGGSYL